MRSASRLTILSLAGLLASTGACAAAAAGAAGAAGAVYYSERGAESTVNAPVGKTTEAVQKAFKDFNITETRSQTSENLEETKRLVEGTGSNRDVKVTIMGIGDQSKVEVIAEKSAVTFDKDLARAILQRVVSLVG